MSHAAILDALSMRYSAESVNAVVPDFKQKFLKIALQCQSSYVRTLIAVEGLRLQRQGKAVVNG
jgi:hypothetical protein